MQKANPPDYKTFANRAASLKVKVAALFVRLKIKTSVPTRELPPAGNVGPQEKQRNRTAPKERPKMWSIFEYWRQPGRLRDFQGSRIEP